jgi:hypothetical protein
MTFPRTILAVCTSVVLIAPVPSVAASTVAYVTGPPPCTTTGAQRPAQTAQQANQAAYSAMALQRQEAAMFSAMSGSGRGEMASDFPASLMDLTPAANSQPSDGARTTVTPALPPTAANGKNLLVVSTCGSGAR